MSVKCGHRLLSQMAAASQVVSRFTSHAAVKAVVFLFVFANGSRVCPSHGMVVFNARLPSSGLGQVCSRKTITTDASKIGWGAMWKNCPVRGSR